MTEISLAEFGAMSRVTATALAEERYHANRARAAAGRATELPDPRALFRPTLDGPALRKHAEAAFDEHELREVTPAEREAAGDILGADIDSRFPPAEMAVLARYGFAREHSAAYVVLSDRRAHAIPMAPRMLPDNANSFSAAEASDRAMVPAAAKPALERLHALRRERGMLSLVLSWPGKFKATNGRAPRWAEIERHWPILGRYLADRRAESMA